MEGQVKMYNAKLGGAYRSGYCSGFFPFAKNPYKIWRNPFMWFAFWEGARNAKINQDKNIKNRRKHVRFY